jgi:hypothetical protein
VREDWEDAFVEIVEELGKPLNGLDGEMPSRAMRFRIAAHVAGTARWSDALPLDLGTIRYHLRRDATFRARVEAALGRAWPTVFLAALRATRSVRAAADEAGRSRQAAYKLKAADPAFAAAWDAALAGRPAVPKLYRRRCG